MQNYAAPVFNPKDCPRPQIQISYYKERGMMNDKTQMYEGIGWFFLIMSLCIGIGSCVRLCDNKPMMVIHKCHECQVKE